MNTLQQDDSLLIGSAKEIKRLAEKESASLLVVSDSHFGSSILYRIITEYGPRSDALVFCGDGISDIAAIIEKASTEESFSYRMPPVISIVEGNGDVDRYPVVNPQHKAGKDDDVYKELTVPLTQKFTAAGHIIFSTHGHRFSLLNGTNSLADAAKKQKADIALYGHTHIALAEQKPALFMLNPGSCARPRAGQPPCFAQIRIKKDSTYIDYTFYEVTASGEFPAYIPDVLPHW